MNITLRQTAILFTLVLVLLIGLVGWTMKMATAAPVHHGSAVSTSHILADGGPGYICPPPPYYC